MINQDFLRASFNETIANFKDLSSRVSQLEAEPKMVSVGGVYAPSDAAYIVVTASAGLTQERSIDVNNGLTYHDFGANNPFQIDLGTPSNITSTSTNSVAASSHTHALDTTVGSPGTYGTSTKVAQVTVDSKGRITAVSEVSVSGTPPAMHTLLGSYHVDTVTDTVSRGSLIYGNSAPEWDELVYPGSGYHFQTYLSDVLWSQDITMVPNAWIGRDSFLAHIEFTNQYLNMNNAKVVIGDQNGDNLLSINDSGGASRLQLGVELSGFGSVNATHGMKFITDTDNNSTVADFIFGTNAPPSGAYVELMRLTDEGNLEVRPMSGVGVTVNRSTGQPSIKANAGAMIIDSTSTSACYLNYYVSNNVILAIGGGNVGVGAAPTVKLDVNGDIHADMLEVTAGNAIDFARSTYNVIAFYQSDPVGAGAGKGLHIYNETTASYLINILEGGNVGFGFTNPTEKLHVNGKMILGNRNADDVIELNDSGGVSRLQFGVDSAAFGSVNTIHGMKLVTDTDNNSTVADFIFGTNAVPSGSYTELMRLTDEGNLKIYPTSGSGLLVSRYTGTASIKSISVHMIVDSNGGSCYLNNYVSDDVLIARGGGNVGVGPIASPTARLHVEQDSTTGAIPVTTLDQSNLSEEFINFVSSVGTGYPINTTSLGSYYGRVRVAVNGTFKWLALYN